MFLFSELNGSCWDSFLPAELLTLLRGDLSLLPKGKSVLIPDKLWVNRFDAEIKAADGREWEAHRDFADLQIILQGSELCLLAAPGACTSVKAYDKTGDCEMFLLSGKELHSVCLTPGTAVLIPPPLVHLPDVASASFTGTAPKVVAKIHCSLLH